MTIPQVSKRTVARRLKQVLGVKTCEPEDVGLDSESLRQHTAAQRCHVEKGFSYGDVECILKDNKLVYVDTVGHQDVEMKIPLNEKSLFRCYSMSKPITGFGFLLLWQEGKLNLDDPVAKYIPEFAKMVVFKKPSGIKVGPRGGGVVDAKKLITLRHLVTHTSGLAYGASRNDRDEIFKPTDNPIKLQYADFVRRVESGKVRNLEAYCQELAKQPLRFEPGTQWEYSYGVDVIGRVLEVVSGLPLDRFLKERVLDPIGMRDTAFFISPKDARKRLTAFYQVKKPFTRVRFDGRRPEKSSWVKSVRAPIFAGGGVLGSCDGGLVSSTRDQALFANVIANKGYSIATRKQVIKESTLRIGCRDWISWKASKFPCPLPGWHVDEQSWKTGWAPLGITEGDYIYMGGVGWWSVNLRSKTVLVAFTTTSWDSKGYRGWKDEVDDFDSAAKVAEEKFQKRALAEDGSSNKAKKHRLS